MNQYTVSIQAYFDGLIRGEPILAKEIFTEPYLRCQSTMRMIIERHNLFEKQIVPIGGSYGMRSTGFTPWAIMNNIHRY